MSNYINFLVKGVFMNIFNEVDKFFSSLKNYLNYNIIFIIFCSLFLLTVVIVIIATSRAYEARLIKAVDMFNNYFIDNPQITEENLVSFNNKMKSRKVPKQLRKQWQQYVLYREEKASHYMSFDICVSAPIKNSSYKRAISVMNILTYIYVFAAILLNLYYSYEFSQDLDLILVLQRVLLCPILILVLNYIITIFLDLRHNAIVSDLYQNYQYFEVNIDKATQTLPEYVDYEVLFDRNEIRKGIPILYAYLQKRAEEEKRELERARLKNVEHEKFNFDEAGVESSLVLERAMQEAENYIAERKKYMQDIEQINADITQEEMNFRETTKEYQRQMQVSKESFDNFKAQLEEVSSTIEANYLKKQQQQELDRQRNLERDYDTATDRHKKLLESYQAELTSVENEIKNARKTLEKGMMSEFDTYSNKVYDAAKKAVEEREKENHAKLKQEIKNLEEKIVSKDKELDNIYGQNQALTEKLDQQGLTQSAQTYQYQQPIYTQQDIQEEQPTENQEEQSTTEQPQYNYDQSEINNYQSDEQSADQILSEDSQIGQVDDMMNENQDVQPIENQNLDNADTIITDNELSAGDQSKLASGINQYFVESSEQDVQEPVLQEDQNYNIAGENNVVRSEDIFTIQDNESKPVKKAGRPRKEKTEEKPKKAVGRPRKEKTEETPKQIKKRGRPKKIESVNDQVGEPNMSEESTYTINEPVENLQEKKPARRGRPKKVIAQDGNPTEVSSESKKRGRPKKESTKEVNKPTIVEKKRGRPKKEKNNEANSANKVGSSNKNKDIESTESIQSTSVEPKKRGRPKKVQISEEQAPINDIDAYLKEIDDQIAKESAKLEKTKKELEKNSNISDKKE